MDDAELLHLHPDLPREPGPDPAVPPLHATPVVHAAVSVVVRARGEGRSDTRSGGGRAEPGGVELLLIKRASNPEDPWSGHIAFPGGKYEPRDPHLLAAARRETREETALELPDHGHPGFLGRLPPVSPRGAAPLPPLIVTPFLFQVERSARARVASAEVERIQWVPLAHLLDPANRIEHRLPVGGAVRRFPAIRLGEDRIWGLTWRILSELMGRVG